MISVIRTDSGNFNLIGTSGGSFCLQGNLTVAELKQLVKEAQLALKGGS